MSNTKRQRQLDEFMGTEYMIDGRLDFKDCSDVYEVIDATCKLLVDNFGIGIKGTYIREIIEQACYESMKRDAEQ